MSINPFVLAMAIMALVLMTPLTVQSQTAYIQVTKYQYYNCVGSVTGHTNYTIGQCLSTGSFSLAYWLIHHYNSTTNEWIGSDVVKADYRGSSCTWNPQPYAQPGVSYVTSIGSITPGHTALACQEDAYLPQEYPNQFTIVNPLAAPTAPFSSYPPQYWYHDVLVYYSGGAAVRDCHLGNDTLTADMGWIPWFPSEYQCISWYGSSYRQQYCNTEFAYFAVYSDFRCANNIPLTTRMYNEVTVNPKCSAGDLEMYYCVPPPNDFIATIASQENIVIKRYFSLDDQCQSINNNDTYLGGAPRNDVVYSQAAVCFSAIDDHAWTQYSCINHTMTGELSIIETKYSSSSCTADKITSQYTFQPNVCGAVHSTYPNITFVCTSYQPYVPPVPVSSSSSTAAGDTTHSSSSTGNQQLSHATNSYESNHLYLALSSLLLMRVVQTTFWN